MKKIIYLVLMIVLLLCFSSCKANEPAEGNNDKSTTAASTATEAEIVTSTGTEANTDAETTIKPTSAIKTDLIKEYVGKINFLAKRQYGLFLEHGFASENQTSSIDKSSEGYLDYFIYDFDKDNNDELLLISHRFKKPSCMDLSTSVEGDYHTEKESYICAEIYDADSGKVVKKDEVILFTTGENKDGYSDLIVFNYKDTVQIGFGRSRLGFFGDGQDTGFCAVKYNGSHFEKVIKEYWVGSGDIDMFRNIFDKLYEVYGIPEDKIYQGGLFDAFQNSNWMTQNFDIIKRVISISVNPYHNSEKLKYYDGQSEISFKISWK